MASLCSLHLFGEPLDDIIPFQLFGDFTDDIKRHILTEMLVISPRTITNPWEQMSDVRRNNSRGKRHPRNTFFNINILATCKYFHEIGLKLLYEQNTFLFTTYSEMSGRTDICSLDAFLGATLTVHRPGQPGCKVRRAAMIRKVVIQYSDIDCHLLARKGYARPMVIESNRYGRVFNDPYITFMTSVLRQIFRLKCNFSNLTVIVDEDDPNVMASLYRWAAISGGRGKKGYMAYQTSTSASGEPIFERFPWYGHHMKIALLSVLGCISPIEDAQKTRHPSGARGAKAIENWISAHQIKPTRIQYTGPFKKRVLDELGNLPDAPSVWDFCREDRQAVVVKGWRRSQLPISMFLGISVGSVLLRLLDMWKGIAVGLIGATIIVHYRVHLQGAS
ncbi:uncharacterized protein RSE6_14431 [Rhynchosporium secalis]|uniref:Uncharacterized protein n=1 Tax=Rhynchosporium secalis TaxID=38038 RepID=A0A1E1MV99_RHYSE|nr:uncharacterized protein RSE6_14431 [Rhynchosporium secalis]